MDINDLTEDKQIELINTLSVFFSRIRNPSEKVQLATMRKNGYAIRYVKNPSYKVQLVAVRKYRYSIANIQNVHHIVYFQYVHNPKKILGQLVLVK